MDHETRVRVLKQIVDEAVLRLMIGGVAPSEAQAIAERVRNQARLLIPSQMHTYDLIYGNRLRRVIEQFVQSSDLER